MTAEALSGDDVANSKDGSERLSVRISASTRDVIEQIKRDFGYRTDADVIRHALGTQSRIGESVARKERIYVGDAEGTLLKELVFVVASR